MNTPQDVKNWYLNDSFNSTNSTPVPSASYRIACLISPCMITYLMGKQEPGQIYLGSNLEIIINADKTKINKLLVYSYEKDPKTGFYLAGRSDYILKDVEIKDYEYYFQSNSYYYLAISQFNIKDYPLSNTQAIQTVSFLANQTVSVNTNDSVYTYVSSFETLTSTMRVRYLSSIINNTKFYNPTPSEVVNYLSRTPSTLIFANELEKKVASGSVC